MSRAFLFCLGVVSEVCRIVRELAAGCDLDFQSRDLIPIRAEARRNDDNGRAPVGDRPGKSSRLR